MEDHSEHQQKLKEDFSEKVLQGGNLAIDRLIERKRKEDGYLVVWQNGKVVKIKARELVTTKEKEMYKPL